MKNTSRKIIGWTSFIILLLVFISLISGSYLGEKEIESTITNEDTFSSPLPTPEGYLHRPILEFFTGLSCPSCMGGPHQDLESLWDENSEDPKQPFTFVVFHELNGGGVDDLADDESKERMQFYQPGISGTPDAEFDGGYIKLGGLSTNSIDYQSANEAIKDCTDRYRSSFNPLRPLQSIRNDFKYVELFVDQVFTGDGFAINVQVEYLGTNAILPLRQLQGSLYVFMVEDNVNAYSKVKDEFVINRNVFRDYAIENEEFTLTEDNTYTTTVEWKIPETKVSIKPGDITAVAAVYDFDDTSSEEGSSGNDAKVPRCIQSATPQSSAYDRENDIPKISKVETSLKSDLEIKAQIDDEDGIAKAYVLYNTEAPNSTKWSISEMKISGEELCDDNGVCYAYADSMSSALISVEDSETIFFMILAYDGAGLEHGGIGAQGKSQIYNFTISGGSQKDKLASSFSIELIGLIIGIILIFFIIVAVIFTRKKKFAKDESHQFQNKLSTKRKISKKTYGIVLIIIVAIIVILSIYAYSFSAGTKHASDFTLNDINGKEFSLSEFNDKIVVIDFMFTTCSGCIEEMKHLKKIHNEYGDKIEIITISISSLDSNEDLRKFKEKYGGDWLYARDTENLIEKYNAHTVPKIVIVDRNENIIFSHVGIVSEAKLSDKIDEGLANSAAPVPIGVSLGLAGTAVIVGVGTFFSPCSFPLLPGYMSYYVGLDESTRIRKALLAGATAAFGLMLLLIFIGLLVGISGNTMKPYIPLFEPFIGLIIFILGIIMLTNYTIPFYHITSHMKKIGTKIPVSGIEKTIQRTTYSKFSFKSANENGYTKLFLYGMAYGGAAAGCTAPLLIWLILSALTSGGFFNALLIFFICALVMGILMISLTLLTAMSFGNLIQKLKVSSTVIKRISGCILIIVGAYLISYYFLSPA